MNELETNVYINICIYTYNIYIWMINHKNNYRCNLKKYSEIK